MNQAASPEPARQERRGVRLAPDEAWSVIEASHTGILATLRRDGVPVMLPLWFVVVEQRIYFRTGHSSRKAQRIRHDARASFLVESGERWAELAAVHLTGVIREVDAADPLAARVSREFDGKYSAFRTPRGDMAEATRAHYDKPQLVLEFSPDARVLSWDNARLGLS